jgi:protein arginine N-methyltransferase 1
VSMWQGYCLFYENRLEKLIWIRDKYLVEGGLMFPDWVNFKMALIEDEYYYDKKINFWDEVYNVNMSCIKDWVLTEPFVDLVDPSVVASDTFKVLDYSLEHIKLENVDFSYQYELTALESTYVHAVVMWFELHFSNGPHENVLSTSPFMPKTRWKQTIFYLKDRLELKDGDRIHGSIAMKRVKFDKSNNFKVSVHHKDSHIVQYYTTN